MPNGEEMDAIQERRSKRIRVPDDVAYIAARLIAMRAQPGAYALHFTIDDRGIRWQEVVDTREQACYNSNNQMD